MNITTLIIAPLITAAVISFLAAPVMIRLANLFGLIDDPRVNKHPKVIHTVPTARGGGGGIFISILISTLIFLPIDNHLKGILAGALLITILGLLDDKYNLNPYIRLVTQIIAAACPIVAGIGISYITNPLGGIINLSDPRVSFFVLGEVRTLWIISDIAALIWIVTLMNFLNMGAKGVAGQLSGVVAISAIIIAMLSLQFSADIAEWPVTILASILAGAFIGFIPWHIEPQRIMPSFSGSNLAGYLLGVLSILTTTKIGTLSVVLAIPLIDTTYTIIGRILKGKSPVWGDRGHLHHRLLDRGWSTTKIAYFYWVVTMALGFAALHLNTYAKLTTIGLLAIGLLIFLIWIQLTKK